MKQLAIRKAVVLGMSLGALGIAGLIAACSGSSSTDNGTTAGTNGGGNGNPDGGGGSTVSNKPGTCASPTVSISFSPMYSAFIPGSTAHQFQIPAIVDDGSSVTWSASDPTIAQLTPDPTSGGVMVTVQGVGAVNIIATKADGTCGLSALNITSATEDDWATGNARYNDGVTLHFGPPDGGGFGEGGFGGGDGGDGGHHHGDGGGGGFGDGGGGFGGGDGGSVFEQDGGTACTNCHGPTASSVFKDVAHTPEQTGGFSDDDLAQIIVNGIVPDGGYFDPNVIIADASADPTGQMQARAYQRWQGIHQWTDITSAELPGIIVYLRSLQPQPQTGSSNFGGGHHHDGGGGGGGNGGGGGTADASGE